MAITREWLDAGLVYIAALGLIAALLTAMTIRRPFRVDPLAVGSAPLLGGTSLGAGLVAYLLTANGDGAALAALLGTVIALLIRLALPRLTIAGALQMALVPLGLLLGGPWSWLLLREHGAPAWLMAATALGIAASALLMGFAFAEGLARQAMLTHRHWRRPHRPLPHLPSGQLPFVSIHLPCYAEPPQVVIEVLDRLAALAYPRFEVLVCDNNTRDEALWRPLERHCALLNERLGGTRFHFFHVAPLPGAKAGALNYLLDRLPTRPDLIAVIDADYLAEPDFLTRLVGFFDDDQVAYVQTPHDYRAWGDSTYLRACYWEYMPSNKVEMPGINEYGAAFTIGTMCLIRHDALELAGRWAEWCLTEDSEVSVRLRQLGFTGLYLRDTFGRGLIPETFDDYKKQRFRWTAGPVQQLRRHWRLYVPRSFGGTDEIGGWSKLLEVQRAVAPLVQLAGSLFAILSLVTVLLAAASGTMRTIDLPRAAWLLAGGTGVTLIVATIQRYALSGCRSLRDMALAELARLSLSYIQMVGGVSGLSRRPIAWRRTPKFTPERSGLRAIAGTMPETAIGLGHLALLAAITLLGARGDLLLLTAIACATSAARFLAAPAMALLGERHLRRYAPPPAILPDRPAAA